MSITKERKAELIKEYGDSDTDSGHRQFRLLF